MLESIIIEFLFDGVEPDAIDLLVDTASSSRKGSILGKTVDLARMAAAYKLNKTGEEPGMLTAKDVKELLILTLI